MTKTPGSKDLRIVIEKLSADQRDGKFFDFQHPRLRRAALAPREWLGGSWKIPPKFLRESLFQFNPPKYLTNQLRLCVAVQLQYPVGICARVIRKIRPLNTAREMFNEFLVRGACKVEMQEVLFLSPVSSMTLYA